MDINKFVFEGAKYAAIGAFAGLGPVAMLAYGLSRGGRNASRDDTESVKVASNSQAREAVTDRFG